MQDLEHENYMLKSILETSPSSESFSFDEYRKVSPAYYNDLKLQLLEKYQDKKLTDIEGSKVIETPYGDALEIVQKEKIDFRLAENNFKNLMNHNLKLLPKIGIKTEQKLKSMIPTEVMRWNLHRILTACLLVKLLTC